MYIVVAHGMLGRFRCGPYSHIAISPYAVSLCMLPIGNYNGMEVFGPAFGTSSEHGIIRSSMKIPPQTTVIRIIYILRLTIVHTYLHRYIHNVYVHTECSEGLPS